MDESLYEQKKTRVQRPKDPHTLDIFTGEPHDDPPPPARKPPKGARLVLELVIARESIRRDELVTCLPPGVSAGSLASILVTLRRLKMIEDRLGKQLGRDETDWDAIFLVPTETAREWLRKANAAEQRGRTPPPPPTSVQRDPETIDALQDDPYRWVWGRIRILAKRQDQLSADVFFADLGRAPRSREELDAVMRLLQQAAGRGWLRKVSTATYRLGEESLLLPVFKSLIRER